LTTYFCPASIPRTGLLPSEKKRKFHVKKNFFLKKEKEKEKEKEKKFFAPPLLTLQLIIHVVRELRQSMVTVIEKGGLMDSLLLVCLIEGIDSGLLPFPLSLKIDRGQLVTLQRQHPLRRGARLAV
jgi:hypothetical protein